MVIWGKQVFNRRFITGIAGIFFLLGAVHARALDWAPTLLPPPAGQNFRKPNDEFRILIPSTVTLKVLQSLRLELDGIDVTQFVGRDGEYAVVKIPQPLDWGKHDLRIIEYTPDGNILERANWVFQVRKSERFREAQLQGNIDLAAFRRIMEKDIGPDEPKRSQGQGAVALQAVVADADWRLTGRVNFLYDSVQTGQEADIGEYLISRQTPRTVLNVGHHPLNSDSMILDGFNRRGISGTVNTRDKRANLTGFVMRTEAINGLIHGFGVGENRHRTSGVIATLSPFRKDPQKLLLRAEYVRGKGDDAGVAEFGDPGLTDAIGTSLGLNTLITGGEAISLIADGYVFGRKLRLRGEYDESSYDFDGLGNGYGKDDDHAYSLLVHYTPPGSTVSDRPFNWNVGISVQQVGTFFKSIANPSLPNDKRLLSLFGGLNWGGLQMQAFAGRETDNVNDIMGLGRVRTDQFSVNLGYTPQPSSEPDTGWAMFQNAYYTAAVAHANSKQIEDPLNPVAGIVDTESTDMFVSATFNPGTWNWGISHGISLFDDDKDLVSDTRDNLTSLYVNFQIGERLTIGPTLQYDFFEDRTLDIDATTITAGLTSAFILIPDKLNGSLNYFYNHIKATDNSSNTSTETVDMQLVWTLMPAKTNKPGLDLFISGNWQETNDSVTTSNTSNGYQVFTGIRMGIPVAY